MRRCRRVGGGRRPIAATADRTHPAHPSRGERLRRPGDRCRSPPDGRRVYFWILPFLRAEDQFSAPVAYVPVSHHSKGSDVSCDFPRACRAVVVGGPGTDLGTVPDRGLKSPPPGTSPRRSQGGCGCNYGGGCPVCCDCDRGCGCNYGGGCGGCCDCDRGCGCNYGGGCGGRCDCYCGGGCCRGCPQARRPSVATEPPKNRATEHGKAAERQTAAPCGACPTPHGCSPSCP